MWYVVKTENNTEEEMRRLLLKLDGVRDVYLPLYRKTVRRDDGSIRRVFMPTIRGVMFANVDDAKIYSIVSDWGYFRYANDTQSLDNTLGATRTVFTGAHLLCHNATDTPKREIIAKAAVPSRDIDRLRVYNDRLVEGIDDFTLVDIDYHALEAENDVVMITEGPYIGFEGIIKQVKKNGKKDRCLNFRVGSFCARMSGIRAHRHIIIREAARGDKAREVNAWRHIDRLIGRIQAELTADEAAPVLRDTLHALNRDVSLDAYVASLDEESSLYRLLSTLTLEESGGLITLSRYFQTTDGSLEQGLEDLIPDVTLRPFLTPTPGKALPPDRDYTLLPHRDFTEVTVRTDLRPYFRRVEYDDGSYRLTTAEHCNPDDYTYYAHIALFAGDGGVTAAVGWGGFLRQYLLLTAKERDKFHDDLTAKGYASLHALLTATPDIFIHRHAGICGFALRIPDASLTDGEDPMADVRIAAAVTRLIAAAAVPAVEMWQGTRLLAWRKLVQRHVLLHKLPVDEAG